MITDPWWSGYVAGIVTAYSPTVLILAYILWRHWKHNGNGGSQ